MTHRRRTAPFALAIILALSALAPMHAQSQRRPITESDLLRFTWVADPQISPDGRQVAYVRVTVNEKKDTYETALWLVPGDGSAPPRRLTSGTRDIGPRWSPDGTRLAFVRTPEKDGEPQPPQVYVLPLGGGEARPVTDLPRGASSPVWAPDGQRVAFSSTTSPDDLDTARARAEGREVPKPSDVRVITRAVYRSNGGGWDDPDRAAHLWVTAVTGDGRVAPATQVTSGEFDERGAVWAADGSRLFFVSDRVVEPYYLQANADVYAVPAAGGALTKVVDINGAIGQLALSPDGKRLAFVASQNGEREHSYDQSDLWVAAVDGPGTARNLTTAYDFDIAGGLGGDQRAPRGGRGASPVWAPDGRTILVGAGERGDAVLVRVDAEGGTVQPVLSGHKDVMSFALARDGRTLAALVGSPTTIGDLFVLDPSSAGAAPKQLTHENDALFDTLTLTEPEEVSWTAPDGRTIQGWLLHPPGFDKSKKYPLILEIHGGPHSAYGNTFTHEFHWMAAKGYVVLFPNPRGSSNYGQEFGNVIQYHYPGDDYADLMAGVDAVLKRGYIDTARLGVTGGSGGGLLTNWVITQTTRFRAAVSQRSIADWSGFWFTADFTQFTPSWFRKAPWEDPQDYVARSPITHVAKVKTPLMLVDGDVDLRTPPSDGGEMMFRALKYLKVPTVMVRFPGESHELSRSGVPSHRVERLRHIVGWFDQWLEGKPNPRYETTSGR